MMIGIIDYGMGNLRSVLNAFAYLGFDACIVSNPTDIQKSDKLVLPGVGAFADAIKTIKKKELDKAILEAVWNGKQFLGICLGMQLIFEYSEENGVHEGLGLLRGNVVKLSGTEKIPHMGWNCLDIKKDTPLLKGISNQPYVYFVHSYYPETLTEYVSATTFYGKDIQIGVQKDNVFAFQFHPEKSSTVGLTILKNFGGL